MAITIDATGVTFDDSSSQTTSFNNISLGFGPYQTWQNVTSSRAGSTTYTNSTTRPIFVMISNSPSGSNQLDVQISGTNTVNFSIPYSGSSGAPGACFVVPNGSSYRIGSSPFASWFELR